MAKQYTGRERVAAAFAREYTDRVPINVGLGPNFAGLAGYTLEEYLTDPEKALKTLAVAYEMIPSDMMAVPGDPTLPAVAAATYKQKYGAEAVPQRPLANKEAVKELELRDPRQSQRYRVYLEMCRRVQAMFPEAAPIALVPGPWSTVVEMRGAQELLYDTADDPEFVHQVMRFATDLNKARALAVAETGVMIRFGDPSAGCSLISPRVYRTFVKPYHQELVDDLRKKGVETTFHICGYIDPIMQDIVDTGVACLELDGPSSLKKMVEISQKKVVLRGNLSMEVFAEGTKEQIEQAVKTCLDIAAEGSAYVISPGCTIPLNAPLENIQYFWEACLKYGRYPLSRARG